MAYDAVVFDLFGTLIDSASAESLIKMFRDPAACLDCDHDEFMSTWLGIYNDRATGRLGGVINEIKHVCNLVGVQASDEQVQAVRDLSLDAFREHCRPRQTVPATLKKLKEMGLKTGLISDCGSEIPDIWADLELASLLDETVFSCCEGITKPNPGLYNLACERLGVRAQRCLFVGDGGSRELTGASAVGMRPVLIRVGYEGFFDIHRADAKNWDGDTIADISEILELL